MLNESSSTAREGVEEEVELLTEQPGDLIALESLPFETTNDVTVSAQSENAETSDSSDELETASEDMTSHDESENVIKAPVELDKTAESKTELSSDDESSSVSFTIFFSF